MGCAQEGMKFIGIELDASYSEIARLRIAAWQAARTLQRKRGIKAEQLNRPERQSLRRTAGELVH